MNTKETLQKRFVLFLIGCMGTRIFLVFAAKNINVKYLPYMGYVALIIALGFAYIYLTGSRKTGGEVFGEQIWWNDLRPVHSALYFLFALYAINRRPMAWIYLAIDVVLGLGMFLMFHWTNGDIARLMV
jgi:hypothetical protein